MIEKQPMIGISDNAGIYRKKLLLLRDRMLLERPRWLDDADYHELKKGSLTGIAKIIIDQFELTL